MEQSVNEAWKRLLDEARRELPEATVRTWLEPSEPIALDEGRLILGAPDQFAAEWNESKHASLLARVAERVLGRPTTIVFRVQEDRQRRPQMDFFVAPRESTGGGVATASSVATTPLNERYTFQTFVIGKSNELAAAAAHAVAEAPGKTYNPLFIYGATGLGKTHLMQAIAHAVLEKNPETRLQYFGADVEDPGLRNPLADRLGDRLHQVGLAQPGGAVDEERIVGLARRLGRGVRRRGRQLVGFPDDEGVEGVPLVQRLGTRVRGNDGHGGGSGGRHEKVHLGTLLPILVHSEYHRCRLAEHGLGESREDGRVLGLVPLDGELVRRSDDETALVQGDRLGRLKPGPDRVIWKFAVRLIEDALPCVFSG